MKAILVGFASDLLEEIQRACAAAELEIAADGDILIVGPDDESPITTAQRHDGPTILIAPPEGLKLLKAAVLVSPFLSEATQCWSLEEDLEAKLRSTKLSLERRVASQAMAKFAAASIGAPKRTDATALLGSLLDHAPLGVALLDSDDRVLAWNQTAVGLTGVSERKAIGASIGRVLGIVNPGDELVTEVTFEKAEGTLHFELMRKSVAEGTLAVFTDITARVVASRELKATYQELEARVEERTRDLKSTNELLLEEVAERVSAQDELSQRELLLAEAQKMAHMGSFQIQDGNISGSDELYEILGVNHLGGFDDVLALAHPDDRADVASAFKKLQKGAKTRIQHRIMVAGEIKILEIRAQPARGVLVGTATDITDRVHREEEQITAQAHQNELARLRDMNAFRSRFMNATAHELSTPLTPMKLQFAIIRKLFWEQMSAEQQQSHTMLERNFNRLESLVAEVLETVRLEAGEVGLVKVHLDLKDIVAESIQSVEPLALETGVLLGAQLSSGIIDADKRRIAQVIDNLLSNAIKYGDGKPVTVRCGESDGNAFIEVRDQGLGLSPQLKKELFEPFTRIHDASLDIDGTGLGLHISRTIVDRHGGSITAKSDGLGKGSCFTVRLASLAKVSVPRTE